jgi:hypothetical protein
MPSAAGAHPAGGQMKLRAGAIPGRLFVDRRIVHFGRVQWLAETRRSTGSGGAAHEMT